MYSSTYIPSRRYSSPHARTGKHGCPGRERGFEEKTGKEKKPSDADAAVVGIDFLVAAVGHLNAMRSSPFSVPVVRLLLLLLLVLVLEGQC